MALGPRDTSSLVMLTGWDATALKNFDLEQGTNYTSLVSDINTVLQGFSQEINNHPLWSSLVSYSDEPDVEYRVGASNGFGRFTEYGRADAKRAATEGHMIPLKEFDRRLGWTWSYLRRARETQLRADIRDVIDDARDNFRVQVLTRVLKRGDDTGSVDGLGSTGISPGFATDAGSTAVDFTPPTYGGTSFTSAHEHYVGISGGAFTNAVFTDAKSELREHGHEPPYEFIIGASDETTVKALTDFTEAASSTIAYGNDTSLARVNALSDGVGTYYIGSISDFNVRVVLGVPQYYGFGWKSYGPNSVRNPLRIRLGKGATAYAVVQMPDPNGGGGGFYPVQETMMYTEYGVGVMDRTNGTARYVNNATWADGTPT